MAPVVPKSALPQIEKFLEHRVTDFGVSAHELIGKIHALKRPDLDEIKALESIDWRKSPDQGYAVLAGIAGAGSKADFAAPLLLAMLDSMPPPYLEVAALDVLGKIKTEEPKAIAAIIDRLAAKDMYVRNKARITLAQVDPKKPAVIRNIAIGFKHDDLNVRLGVASTLRVGRFGTHPGGAMDATPLLGDRGARRQPADPHLKPRVIARRPACPRGIGRVSQSAGQRRLFRSSVSGATCRS